MSSMEKYLKPEVINQIKRLDLRAQFVVKGFLQGLHASPFQGFSVEFSEHRKYTPGDDPKDIDWLVYAKTGKYYVKKFEAEVLIGGRGATARGREAVDAAMSEEWQQAVAIGVWAAAIDHPGGSWLGGKGQETGEVAAGSRHIDEQSV